MQITQIKTENEFSKHSAFRETNTYYQLKFNKLLEVDISAKLSQQKAVQEKLHKSKKQAVVERKETERAYFK